jgi:hypothetical protein
MQKGIVYVALILAIVVIFCAISTNSKTSMSNNKSVVTENIQDVQIDHDVTTNIWDYIHEQQSSKDNTLGDSENDETVTTTETPQETNLTIIIK